MLSSCPWPAFSSSSRDSHFSQIQIYSFLKLCRRFQSQVKSGLKTTDLGAHGHLHSEITSCMVDVATQTWMFSLPRTLDNWSLHSFCCCLLFPPVANCRSFNPHLPGVDFRPVNCLIIDARVVHNFFSITPPWFPFVIMAWNSKTVTDCLFNKLLVFEHLLSASHLAQLYTGIWEIYTGNRNWLRHVSWAKTKNWVSSGRNSWFNFFFFPVAEKGN